LDDWISLAEPRLIAPEAIAALDRLEPAARRAVDPDLADRLFTRVRATLGVPGYPALADPFGTDRERVALDFAEQFVVDVASVSDAQRAALGGHFGAETFAVAQVIWVADASARIRAAWDQLFADVETTSVGPPPGQRRDTTGPPAADDGDGDLWPLLESFLAAVARLDHLDPLTTEMVRLRGARAHNCQLCRSRRYVRALEAGGDEATFDQIDDYEHSELPERHRVALRLTDAMVWTPMAWPDALAPQVRRSFAPGEAVELVLDVARNSANKIAVALGADQAQVPAGELELYDVGADGQLIAGLSRS
jgi:alkylhydroperoxidase family enzyme